MHPILSNNQDEREGLQMRRKVDDGVLLVRRGNFPQQMRPITSHHQDEREGLQMRREVDDGVLLVRRGDFPQQMLPYHSSSNTTFYAGTHNPLVNPTVYP